MRVDAKNLWNDTGLDVVDGDMLGVSAAGQWTDWYVTCGPDGYAPWYLALLGGLRRMPAAKWFELVACAGQDLSNCVAVGDRASFVVKGAGRLYLFANDAPFAYGNNTGSLAVTLTRDGQTVVL